MRHPRDEQRSSPHLLPSGIPPATRGRNKCSSSSRRARGMSMRGHVTREDMQRIFKIATGIYIVSAATGVCFHRNRRIPYRCFFPFDAANEQRVCEHLWYSPKEECRVCAFRLPECITNRRELECWTRSVRPIAFCISHVFVVYAASFGRRRS